MNAQPVNTVTIGRFRHRIVLPPALARAGDPGPQVRRAIDLLTGLLPGVLVELRLPPSTLICVRSLSVRLRVGQLALADTDLLARAWAEAISAAVENAYATGISVSGPDAGVGEVVVYRNRAAALTDLVRRVALGDLRRRWAWEQSGLVSPADSGHPTTLAVGACLRGPDVAVPVLAWAAGQGWLEPLALTWAGWHALARALVPVVPAANELASTGRLPAGPAPVPEPARPEGTLPTPVRAALTSAPLAGQIRRSRQRLGDPPAGSRTAIAALALTAAGAGVRVVELPAAARLLFAPEAPIAPVRDARPVAPAAATTPAEPPQLPVGPAGEPFDEPLGVIETARPADEVTASAAAEPAAAAAAATPDPPDGAEPGAWTTRAGLLFTLNLAALRLIAAGAAVHVRGPAWCLLALGCRLAECDAADPAVRVFAGLATTVLTGAPLELHLTEPTTAADERLLGTWVARCDEELAARLPGALPAAELRRSVIQRTAPLLLDPGWIEAELPLDGVDVAIRRAGLDLDPGAVAHLGCVVRFRYV
ncbi:hypothetical protein AB0L70_35850 [Kribbella sp. NPDC051952]|uniref:hypothetical protein n=1 Tax=Kribbella sp. NPDC051952 TaxID=3154851 RepID=UPI00343C53D7